MIIYAKYIMCVCYLMHMNMTSNYNEHAQTRTEIPFNWTTFPTVTLQCLHAALFA